VHEITPATSAQITISLARSGSGCTEGYDVVPEFSAALRRSRLAALNVRDPFLRWNSAKLKRDPGH
jgi:hypothetical protein